MDLSNLNMEELRDLEKQVQLSLKSRQGKELETARNEIYAIAHRMGLPLKSLIELEKSTKPAKVAVKYRNPRNQSEEWAGRGRQPKWVQQLIAAGGNIESARV